MKSLLVKVIGRITPTCQNMTRLCSQSLDRKLSLRERISMRMHCWICSWCIDYSKQLNTVSSTVRDEAESLAELKDDKLSDDCKARMQAMVDDSAIDSDKVD